MKSHVYQRYLQDLNTLNQIRKRKAVSLQDSSFKGEIESIKKIEKQWVQEPDSVKSTNKEKDILLNQSAAVVSDLAELKRVKRQTVIRTMPSLN